MKNLALTCCWVIACIFSSQAQNSVLWYNAPAEKWEEALPLGNGRLGAMVFGKTGFDRIQLNEDSLWPGGPEDWGLAEGKPEDLAQIRKFLIEGNHHNADSLMVLKFSRKGLTRSHQTLGDLWLDFDWKEVSEYRRSLDLEKAVAEISFLSEGYQVRQQVFASAPDQAVLIQLTTDHPAGFNGKIRLNRPSDQGFPTAQTTALHSQLLELSGMVTQRSGQIDSKPFPITDGVKFRTLLSAQSPDGKINDTEAGLEIAGAKTLYLKLVTATSFYHPDYEKVALDQLEKISFKSWGELQNAHEREYQSWFNRMSLTLGPEHEELIPTDQRIARVKNGQVDLHLEKLLFDFGRYLLISSSRPGTNPANLQGIWNQHIAAPWNADYHLNINLQMNYWPAEVTGLSELHLPLFDFTDGLIDHGKKAASTNFNMRGAMLPHTTDIWKIPFLQAATAYWGSWIGAGAWLGRHYWEHYLFTGDVKFLRERALPAFEQIAQFYSDWLMIDPRDGKLVSAPSTSPENQFINEKGIKAASTLGAAMDQQLIEDIFSIYLKTTDLLQAETPLKATIEKQLKSLRPGVVLGADGRILEWDRPYEEPEKGHRHMSHLYAFHPGNAITLSQTPAYFDAVKRTLQYRLDHGGAGTGWSRAWLINFSARLMDGEMAHDHIQKLISQSLYPNLFDAHPPFQIDGNFGYTSGIAEMLIQSHEEGIIRILPALPKAWPSGKVAGLKARGGFTFDFSWENGEIKTLKIHSHLGNATTIFADGSEMELALGKGESFEMEF
ncbi:MAG: glycosyl hydrolase family 95 catalytic domain-containing protein [Algoriphagus aquaeductus]|uniref:glycoside hydrolase family 95 protein n=1 Tax=Algoriphagus aquaeductus TaxID=475299 RepID=UPI00387A1963